MFNQQGRISWSGGGGLASLESRVAILEGNEYKVAYFSSISAGSGTITKPTNSTILLDQLPGGVDAYLSVIENGQPTGVFPRTSAGVPVTVTSFDTTGAYTLSGTPSAYPVAIVYLLKISGANWSNLTTANIVAYSSNADRCSVAVGWTTVVNPADSTTYYFGALSAIAPPTSDGTAGRRCVAPISGYVMGFDFVLNSGGMSTENQTFQLFNATQGTNVTITSTFSANGQAIASYRGFSLAVNEGDQIGLRWVTPAWVTNPTNVQLFGNLIFQSSFL